jgi:23S rRNA (uracil1939-C5)-methyltransferase
VQHAISFFEDQDQDFDVTVGPTAGWRTVAKLAVRSQQGILRIGLFVPGSHELLEVPQCQAHHPRINSAVEVLQKTCRKHAIQPFDEKTGEGSLRHVAINIERSTGLQQVTLVWKDDGEDEKEAKKLIALCETLIRVSKNNDERLNLHSLWVHYNNSWKHANSIFARDGRWDKKYGPDAVVEHLDVDDHLIVPLQFPPQVFRQGNIDAFSKIILKIRSWLQDHPTKRCLELYGGVGTIGLHLIDLFDTLVSSDENPFNKLCFETTVSELKVQKPKKKRCKTITYESKNATDMVQSPGALSNADLVIVDPPRKGLDQEVVTALCRETGPKHLIYVSCGFNAFTRDFQSLTVNGNWQLDHAEGHVLFPGSDAIETLVFFTRP